MRKLDQDKQLQGFTDEELFQKSIGKNKASAFAGELFKRYAHLVYGVCYRYLKNKANSEDAVMDVFEIFLKNPPSGDLLSFKSWLLKVAKNSCLRRIRDSEAISRNEEKWENFEKSTENFMENEEVLALNSRAKSEPDLHKALKQLKEEQRICVKLFFLDGKSYKEIESQTDYSLNQIKSYLQNGKRKLKILIENQLI